MKNFQNGANAPRVRQLICTMLALIIFTVLGGGYAWGQTRVDKSGKYIYFERGGYDKKTWTVPAGIKISKFEVWGGGGSGGTPETASFRIYRVGGGGGGGAYAYKNATYNAGSTFYFEIGNGGSYKTPGSNSGGTSLIKETSSSGTTLCSAGGGGGGGTGGNYEGAGGGSAGTWTKGDGGNNGGAGGAAHKYTAGATWTDGTSGSGGGAGGPGGVGGTPNTPGESAVADHRQQHYQRDAVPRDWWRLGY